MTQNSYTVEVTGLSPNATEKDVYEFFAFSGTIEHVEIIRYGESACTAYVTFRDAVALETAVLLSGAMILDQRVCITRWGQSGDEHDFWNRPSWKIEEEYGSTNTTRDNHFVPTAGEAVTMAQDVVKTMLSKGYILGKGAVSKAKEFDESYEVSATASAKVAEMSSRIGLTDKIYAGAGAVKSVDDKFSIRDHKISHFCGRKNSFISCNNCD